MIGADGRERPVAIVRVPATSANVGVGFDCLGLALDLTATFLMAPAERLEIVGCEERFRGEDNLVWQSYLDACGRLGVEPVPLHITILSPIPLSGGLGSSSACVIAGIAGAMALSGDGFDRERALELACAEEGHPDNVAPALLGGLVSSFVDDGRTTSTRMGVADNLRFVAIAPPYEVRTADARRVLGASSSERIETMVHDVVSRSSATGNVSMSEAVWDAMMSMRSFLFANLYSSGDAKWEEPKAYVMIEELFDHFVSHLDEVPDEYRLHDGDKPEVQVADFISGMTDRYAVSVYEDLKVPRSWRKR